jgi:biotin carboxyl carrier protein
MKLQIEIDGRLRSIEIVPGSEPRQWQAKVDGRAIELEAHLLRPGVLSLLIEGRAYRAVLEEAADNQGEPAVHIRGQRHAYRIDDPRSLKARRSHGAGHDGPRPIKASMPGRVVRILAQPGDDVAANQGVVVIEAMKMQNELKSPKAGKVVEVRVSAGDTVTAGEVLAVIE